MNNFNIEDIVNIKPLPSVSDTLRKQRDDFVRDQLFWLRLVNKEPEELSEDQKFAICCAAGVPIESEIKDNKLIFRTQHPCGIGKIDGQFRVFTNEKI